MAAHDVLFTGHWHPPPHTHTHLGIKLFDGLRPADLH